MQFDGITLMGTPLHGYRVAGWLDGCTQARIAWESAPPGGYDSPGTTWTPHSKTVQSDLEAMQLLLDIEAFANTRLTSAALEPFQTTPAG